MVKYKHILLACAVAKPGFHAHFFIVSISFLQNERIMCDINLCTTYMRRKNMLHRLVDLLKKCFQFQSKKVDAPMWYIMHAYVRNFE